MKCFQDVYLLLYVLLQTEAYYKICLLKLLIVYKCLFLYTSKFMIIRGCSYGGELARLGGLARLGEISPS